MQVLVIDDDPAARLALVAALAPHYTVTEASSVATALAALTHTHPDAVVLDLCLDTDRQPLHDALDRLGLPVVLVSGVQPEQLPAVARVRGWRFTSKPVEPETLVTQVASVIERRRSRTSTPIPEARPTMAPPAPEVPVSTGLTPPEGTSVRPVADTRPAAVQIRDLETRRRLRTVAVLALGALVAMFELRGHALPGEIIAGVVALGIGPEAFVSAIRKRPAVAGGGLAALVALAVLGDATGSHAVSLFSAAGASSLPLVDHLAERIIA